MIFFFIALFAGILTIVSPCILPLLPVIIGSSEEKGTSRKISRKSLVVITALSVSVILFTLLLKVSTLLIDIPQAFWSWFSGITLVILGVITIFPTLWSRVPLVKKLHLVSNKAVGTGFQKKSIAGDIIIGAALGPVFTTCSPTYFFIIATILPASFFTGFFYLIAFTGGLALSLLLVAFFGQKLTNKISSRASSTQKIKTAFGILFIFIGVLIATGYDKKIESKILDSGYGATIDFEQKLIDRFKK